MNSTEERKAPARNSRYGMVIDVDKCTGCGNCMVACAIENNVPPARARADDRTGITWIRVYEISNGAAAPESKKGYLPLLCQQCDHHTPCQSVCPQNAVEMDPKTGIVGQIPSRCLGCRYCMTACPYHARYFNWWDPVWPEGMERTLNPDVSVRMRGVVEKCNFCSHRYHRAREEASARGAPSIDPSDYVPACVEACPTKAIVFGDLEDSGSEVAGLSKADDAFRLLEKLGTEPKVYYLSSEDWVHRAAERRPGTNGREETAAHG
jgi:menaquinone reductase, iron-sulfur cluster-binding subunit